MHRGGTTVRSVVLTTALFTVVGAGLAAGPAVSAGPDDSGAQAERARPDNTAIRGGCRGTSGRINLTYGPRADDVIPFRIDARHVTVGSRWDVTMFAEELRHGGEVAVDSHARATDGSWSVSGDLDVSEVHGRLFLGAFTYHRGSGPSEFCHVGIADRRQPAIRAWSRFARVQQLVLATTDSGRTELRYTQSGNPGDRWNIEMRIYDGDEASAVSFSARVNRHAALRATVGIGRVDNPRLLVRATDPDGHSAVIGVDLRDD